MMVGGSVEMESKVALLRSLVERKDSNAKAVRAKVGLFSSSLPSPTVPHFTYSRICFQKTMADMEMKVALMRKIVEQKDSDAKDLDDSTLKRFLRARDLDVDRASNFLLKHLSWRRENIPKGFISESEIQNEIAQKKIFSQGFDKNGRPIAVLFGCRHNPSNRDLNEFKRFAAYILEKLCSRMQGKEEKFTIIADLKGWGYSNCDIRAYIAALDILQIIFVEDKNMMTTLLEDIDESQLPEQYGGRLKLVPIEES